MTKLVTSLGFLCVALTIAALSPATKPVIVPAGREKWMPVPGVAGVSITVLYGTPDKPGSGMYFERFKTSEDATESPHYHPTDELAKSLEWICYDRLW